ncbi:hypothetical protein B0H19DRAFT_1386143 [Mycena capillaripes]|nr:hypothetical protein B0H19DRAFT_1386143 [Mycena capillaripes]
MTEAPNGSGTGEKRKRDSHDEEPARMRWPDSVCFTEIPPADISKLSWFSLGTGMIYYLASGRDPVNFRERLKQVIDDEVHRLHGAVNEVAQLRKENQRLISDLVTKKALIEDMKNSLEEVHQHADTLQIERDAARGLLAVAQAVARAQSERSASETDRLKQELADLQKKLDKAHAEVVAERRIGSKLGIKAKNSEKLIALQSDIAQAPHRRLSRRYGKTKLFRFGGNFCVNLFVEL